MHPITRAQPELALIDVGARPIDPGSVPACIACTRKGASGVGARGMFVTVVKILQAFVHVLTNRRAISLVLFAEGVVVWIDGQGDARGVRISVGQSERVGARGGLQQGERGAANRAGGVRQRVADVTGTAVQCGLEFVKDAAGAVVAAVEDGVANVDAGADGADAVVALGACAGEGAEGVVAVGLAVAVVEHGGAQQALIHVLALFWLQQVKVESRVACTSYRARPVGGAVCRWAWQARGDATGTKGSGVGLVVAGLAVTGTATAVALEVGTCFA